MIGVGRRPVEHCSIIQKKKRRYIDITVLWSLKSPASWLFVQQLGQSNNNKNPSKFCITDEENPPVTGRFPAQMANNVESGSTS